MPDYKKLQNGSDIRGVAIAVEGGKPVDLTEEAVRAIGGAFAGWLQSRLGEGVKRISIGRDSRLSGEQLSAWLRDGLSAAGMEVTDFGLCTTPAMFMSTVMEGWEFDGAVMITASHLPFERNGFKFFTAKGGLEKQDIAAILASAGAGDFPAGGVGACIRADFLPAYAELLQKRYAPQPAWSSRFPAFAFLWTQATARALLRGRSACSARRGHSGQPLSHAGRPLSQPCAQPGKCGCDGFDPHGGA